MAQLQEDPMAALLNKQYLEQVLVASVRFYQNIEITQYDEELLQSVDSRISQLWLLSERYKDCPLDDKSCLIASSCLEQMLNLREELIKLKQSEETDLTGDNTVFEVSSSDPEPEEPNILETLQELTFLAEKCRDFLINFETSLTNLFDDERPKCKDSCVYCTGAHSAESCPTLTLINERIHYLHAHHLCSRCLKSLANFSDKDAPHLCVERCFRCSALHHVSICSYEHPLRPSMHPSSWPKRKPLSNLLSCVRNGISSSVHRGCIVKAPFVEPSIANSKDYLLTVPTPIVHPRSIMAMLVLPGLDPHSQVLTYVPSVVLSAHHHSRSVLARAHLNVLTCSASFVSLRLVAALKLVPISIAPIPVEQLFGYPLVVDSYVELNLSSLYKPYQYRRVFYVLDLTCLRISRPSSEMKTSAKQSGVTLSSELWHGPTSLDLIIGYDQYELTGLQLDKSNCTITLAPDLLAEYTHFGYILTGTDNKTEVNRKNRRRSSSGKHKERASAKCGKENLFYSYDKDHNLI